MARHICEGIQLRDSERPAINNIRRIFPKHSCAAGLHPGRPDIRGNQRRLRYWLRRELIAADVFGCGARLSFHVLSDKIESPLR